VHIYLSHLANHTSMENIRGNKQKILVWSEVVHMNKNAALTFFLELKITHT